MGPFHMAFCGGGTRVEVSPHSFSREIWAAVEVTSPDCFEECRDCGAAHRLMRKFDAVGFGSDDVCEETKFILFCFVGLDTSTPGDG